MFVLCRLLSPNSPREELHMALPTNHGMLVLQDYPPLYQETHGLACPNASTFLGYLRHGLQATAKACRWSRAKDLALAFERRSPPSCSTAMNSSFGMRRRHLSNAYIDCIRIRACGVKMEMFGSPVEATCELAILPHLRPMT